jgi:hypothetical protein
MRYARGLEVPRAAKAELPEAQYMLGIMYAQGWIIQAAYKGYAVAQRMLEGAAIHFFLPFAPRPFKTTTKLIY